MKRKEISRLIARILSTSIVLNTSPGAIKSVYAMTQDIQNESLNKYDLEDDDKNSDNDDNGDSNKNLTDNLSNDSSKLNNVSIEEMQSDFENIANSPSLLSDNEKNSESTENNNDEDSISSQYIYLSDIDYDTSLSNTQWKKIMKDANTDGLGIRLKFGERVINFPKGMGAHASSTIVYDISQYSNTYTRLSTYLGVDYGQNGKGDGVKFSIYTSNDKSTWKEVESTDVLIPSGNSEYVNIDITGVKYIKLYADSNGNNGNDHAVYGDLKLMKSDSINVNGLKTLDEYDAEISSNTVEENFNNNKKLVLERELVNRIGYGNLIQAYNKEGVSDALAWLKSDENNLQLFIEAGNLYNGSGYNALIGLGKLYNEFKEDLTNLTYKKMLIATAVAYSKDIKTFMVSYGGNNVPANPIEIYKNFKKLYDTGRFIRQSEFESYPMELVRAVMDSRVNYDEMLWLRDYIDKKYPDTSNWKRFNGYGYMDYANTPYNKPEFYSEENRAKWDEKYDFSRYGISYGDPELFRIWMFMEAGAICWGLSGLGRVVNEVQGIAAIGTFQPGHEAYLLYSQNEDGKGIWSISDDIAGWRQSYSRWGGNTKTEHRLLLGWGQMDYNKVNGGNNTSYTLLAQDALNDYNNYLNSMYYNLIANSYESGSEQHEEALNKSLKHYSKNLDSIYGLFKSYSHDPNTTDEEWIELARKVAREYMYFPAPMSDLLDIIKPKISNDAFKSEVDILKIDSLTKASVATPNESLQDGACREVANSLLGQSTVPLASFSFSGDNSNTILLNDNYANSTIQVRVSLDGGRTWEKFENDQTFTTNHSIKLTDEQVSRINSTDDILVGLMGTEVNHKIDIKAGKAINSGIYKNDDENVLIGDIDNLEYSLDDGATWQDYVGGLESDMRIEGNKSAKFRYKAYDSYLQSDAYKYDFTADDDNEKSKYLQLRHVNLVEFSSQQSTTKDHAAKNFIDGNATTAWHTKFNSYDKKFYVVGFDKVRFINKLTYLPGGLNGKLKAGEIYSSMDGVTWTLASTFNGLQNNSNLQTIDLGKNVQAKYLKIVATENYGNVETDKKMYFSGKMLNFYEDTTEIYNPKNDVVINYSTTSPTSSSVTATLVLPEGCTIIEGESMDHVFEDNSTYNFRYIDANGEEHSATATVNNIDKTLPTMEYEFDYPTTTNKDVTLTISRFSEENVKVVGIEEVEENPNKNNTILITQKIDDLALEDSEDLDENNESTEDNNSTENVDNIDDSFGVYSNTYTFTENKTVIFKIMDEAGNISSVPVTVDWIDRTAPTANVSYSITDPTNQDVIATVIDPSKHITFTDDSNGVHTFESNGSYTFKFVDDAGNEGSITATVNNIDKEAPNVSVQYDITDRTNKSVTATLLGLSSGDKVISDGGQTHVFDTNDEFEFIVQDSVGNESRVTANVNWIDKEGRDLSLDYSTTQPTNGDVTVTLKGLESGDKVISEGGDTHVFTSNGSFEFIAIDDLGNESRITATVNNIDRSIPTATIHYNVDSWTNGNVTATIVGDDKNITVTNTNNNSNSHVFTENGSFKFEFVDDAGNKGEATAEVSWIDKVAPTATIAYSTTSLTNQDVVATIQEFDEDGVTIKNNDGNPSHTFKENGTFDFTIVDKAGNETVIRAEVNNIDKVAPTAKVAFESTSIKDGKVIAKLTDLSEDVTIINPVNVNDYYEFTKNESFTFRFKDKAGNIGEALANVDWINFEDVSKIIKFENLAIDTSKTYSNIPNDVRYVRATFSIDDNIEILNNNGSNTVVFNKNGTFAFKARMRNTGYEFDMTVTVDWLPETTTDGNHTDNDTTDEDPIIDSNLLPPVIVLPPIDDETVTPPTEDNSNNEDNSGDNSENNPNNEDNSEGNSNSGDTSDNSSEDNSENNSNSEDNLDEDSSDESSSTDDSNVIVPPVNNDQDDTQSDNQNDTNINNSNNDNNLNNSIKPNNNEINNNAIIKDLNSIGLGVSISDEVELNTAINSANLNSTETPNDDHSTTEVSDNDQSTTESVINDNTSEDTSKSDDSIDDTPSSDISPEENSKKGFLATVISTIIIALSIPFVLIRKFFGLIK